MQERGIGFLHVNGCTYRNPGQQSAFSGIRNIQFTTPPSKVTAMSSLSHYETHYTSSGPSSRGQGWATLRAYAFLLARVLLMFALLVSGLGKITTYGATTALMESHGVAGALLPAVISMEVFGGYAILLGWKTRAVSLLMSALLLATAMVFHDPFGDPIQASLFVRGLSFAGGLLLLAALGAGPLSLDARKAAIRHHVGTLLP
jgi:putative oxidoreductase